MCVREKSAARWVILTTFDDFLKHMKAFKIPKDSASAGGPKASDPA